MVQALEELGGRVTVGEVASKAGLKVTEVEEGLVALAADTLATLEVSEAGDVLYTFPDDVTGTLRDKSFRLRIEPVLQQALEVGSWGLRVSFGLVLIVSIILVFTTIFILLSSKNNDDSDSDSSSFSSDSSSSWGDSDNGWGSSDSGWGSSWYYYDDSFIWLRRDYYYEEMRRMGFLEAVFSFVFGDGNPNRSLDDARWSRVGKLIEDCGGVVTAEQLAPFLDIETLPDTESSFPDEGFVVPVLQRLQGEPTVDEDGNLLYWFPLLQNPNFTGNRSTSVLDDPKAAATGAYLQEEKWKFSNAGTGQKIAAGLLGLLNLGGVLFLGWLISDPEFTQDPELQGIVPFTLGILPVLTVYASSFFAIPALRMVRNAWRNRGVRRRNELRMKAAAKLEEARGQVERKLLSAAKLAKSKVDPSKSRVVYSTSKDINMQDDVDGAASDFDQRLNDL